MRFAPVFVLLSAALCSAGTITDTFNQPQNNCQYSSAAPYSQCDVIGNESLYDIQSASVTVAGNGATSITLDSNLGGISTPGVKSTLNGFTDSGVPGMTMTPGAVFFYASSNNTTVSNFVNPNVTDFANPSNVESLLTYAVPLVSDPANNLIAGDLYLVNTSSIETAQQALNNPSNVYYRNNLPVLFTSGTLVATGNGVSVSDLGGSNAEYQISMSFTAPSGTVLTNGSGNVGLLWSSADCGNDFIQGDISTGTSTPEPSSFILLLSGGTLVAFSAFARQRAKSRK
jgi:hypothetical protein